MTDSLTGATGKKLRPILILASGRGSNFEAIAEAVRQGDLQTEILAVFSDQKDAPVLEKARKAGVSTVEHVPNDQMLARLHALRSQSQTPHTVVLAGYLRLLSRDFIEAYRDPKGFTQIINIHPSLLPAFPGLNAYRQAFEYGVSLTGATVHLVEHEVDSGPVLAQRSFGISHFKTLAEVEEAGLRLEHALYSETLKWFLADQYRIERRNGRVCVFPS